MLGLHDISKIYWHHDINMHNIHITEDCLNSRYLYSMYLLFMVCVTAYLANQMALYCPRWPQPM